MILMSAPSGATEEGAGLVVPAGDSMASGSDSLGRVRLPLLDFLSSS